MDKNDQYLDISGEVFVLGMGAFVGGPCRLVPGYRTRRAVFPREILRLYREENWCPERVSNPHAFRGRRILSPLRLPIPPSGRREAVKLGRSLSL